MTRTRVGGLAALLTAGLAATTLVVAVPSTVGARELAADDPRRTLEAERRGLDDVLEDLRATREEVDRLDEQLREASVDLISLRDDLVAARAARDRAVATEREARGRLETARERLDERLAGWRRSRGRLADRAVHTFKHGTGWPQEVLVRGVGAAGDWHEVAVTVETLDRVLDEAADDVDTSAGDARRAARAQGEVAGIRAEARAAARDAIDAADEVERLTRRREDQVAQLARQRARRERVLDQLRDDAAARAVLVADLERRVARLELDAGRVLTDVRADAGSPGPPPDWAERLPAGGRDWSAAIVTTAAHHGLDARLLAALVWTESGFRPRAVSSAGALGLAQLMPATARGLGVDPLDPLANLDGGARYLRAQLERFGRVDLALAAYNAGPERVARSGRVPAIVETELYVVRVLERYEQLLG